MKALKFFYKNFEEILCTTLLAIMILCLSSQILLRVLFGHSLAWTEELSRYTFLWSVYVGAALAVKNGAHVRITAQFSSCSARVKLYFRVLVDIIWVLFNIYIASEAFAVIREGIEYPEYSPTLFVAKYWVELIIPVSFLLMTWRIWEIYYRSWKTGDTSALVTCELDSLKQDAASPGGAE